MRGIGAEKRENEIENEERKKGSEVRRNEKMVKQNETVS